VRDVHVVWLEALDELTRVPPGPSDDDLEGFRKDAAWIGVW